MQKSIFYHLDRPLKDMVADFKRAADVRHIWPAHFAGLTREYCQIEKLANLDSHAARILRLLLAGQDPGCQRRVVQGVVPEE